MPLPYRKSITLWAEAYRQHRSRMRERRVMLRLHHELARLPSHITADVGLEHAMAEMHQHPL